MLLLWNVYYMDCESRSWKTFRNVIQKRELGLVILNYVRLHGLQTFFPITISELRTASVQILYIVQISSNILQSARARLTHALIAWKKVFSARI